METQSQKQKEKGTDRGLGSAAKVCLMVKCRSADSLTPGSSGTLAQGATMRTLCLEGRRAHPSDRSSKHLFRSLQQPGQE